VQPALQPMMIDVYVQEARAYKTVFLPAGLPAARRPQLTLCDLEIDWQEHGEEPPSGTTPPADAGLARESGLRSRSWSSDEL